MESALPVPVATPARILDAAEAVVAERGVPALTLDGVARLARVSKGGLLHHFPSKEALLRAMLDRLAAEMSAAYDAALAATPPGTGHATRALLHWVLTDHPQRQERDLRVASVLLAALHHDPALLHPIRTLHGRIRGLQAGDGLPQERAAVVLAAVDGLLLAEVFRIHRPSPDELRAIAGDLNLLAAAI
jgi:AcrR family transcriptional regulator